MNKLLTLLTFIAASAGIYFAFDAVYEPNKPAEIVMPQDAASSPEEDEDEEEIVDEPQQPAKSAASATSASQPTTAMK